MHTCGACYVLEEIINCISSAFHISDILTWKVDLRFVLVHLNMIFFYYYFFFKERAAKQ